MHDLSLSIDNNTWTYIWVTTRVGDGEYNITIKTYNLTSLTDVNITTLIVDNIKLSSNSRSDNKIIIAAILVIIFTIIEVIIILMDRRHRNKVLTSLNIEPNQITYNVPRLALVNIAIFLIIMTIILTIITPLIRNELLYSIFLILNGMTILTGLWAFTHKCLASKLALAFFFSSLWFLIMSMTSMGLYKPPIKITMPGILTGLILGILIMAVYLLIFSFIYIDKSSSNIKKGVSVITIILTLIFLGTIFLTILFANFSMFDWPNSLFLSLIFSGMISIVTWVVYRSDLVFFETREESQTKNTRNMTFNMFDIDGSRGGLVRKDHQKINLSKISYKISTDDNVNIGMISIQGDWDFNHDLAHKIMHKFVRKMHRFSYIKRGCVSVKLYSSDDDFDHKLSLCRDLGFVIVSNEKHCDNSNYQLELQSNQGLFKQKTIDRSRNDRDKPSDKFNTGPARSNSKPGGKV